MATRPSVLLPVGSTATSINDAIERASAAGGGRVKLETGDYTIDKAIVIRSNVTLDLNDSVISAGFFPSVGLADDPTNAMIRTPDVITANVATVLSARITRRSSSATVAGGLFAPGQYLDITGTNANDEGLSEGANMVTTEFVQVAANYAGGATFSINWPTHVWHAAGHTVKSISGIASDWGVINGTVRAPGGTVAVGILARYAQKFDLDNLAFEGFSRAAINIDKGSREGVINDIRGKGEINSLIFVDAGHNLQVTNLRTDSDGLRYHALGVVRGIIHVHNDSADVSFDGARLAHGSCAIWIKHGHNIRVSNVTAYDFDPAVAYTRCVATTEQNGGSFFGIVQTGSTPVPWAAFVGGVTFDNILVDAPSTFLSVAAGLWCFALHDAFGFMGHGLNVNNSSDHGLMRGIHCKDTSGSLTATQVKGVDYGLRMEGSFGIDGVLSNYIYSNFRNPGYANTAIGLNFGQDPTAPPAVFTEVVLASNEGIRLDSPTGAVMADMIVRNVLVHGFKYEYIIPAVNKTGGSLNQVGELAELEPAVATIADVPRIRTPAGQSRKMVVIACGPFDNPGDGNVCWVAPLPQACPVRIRSADTIQPGDFLDVDMGDAGNTKPGKLNNASANPNARAASYKTSGAAEAAVRVTPC